MAIKKKKKNGHKHSLHTPISVLSPPFPSQQKLRISAHKSPALLSRQVKGFEAVRVHILPRMTRLDFGLPF
jgi:hypothetical protein